MRRSPACRSSRSSPGTRHPPEPAAAAEPGPVRASVDESETISRTLLLAQRTADTTVAEAQAEADRLLAAARDDAAGSLDQARAEAAALVEGAKTDARRGRRVRAGAGRGRGAGAAGPRATSSSPTSTTSSSTSSPSASASSRPSRSLNDLVQRVPGGLGDMRRPLLSAAAEPSGDADTSSRSGAPRTRRRPRSRIPSTARSTSRLRRAERDDDGDDAGRDRRDHPGRVGRRGPADATPPNGSLFDEDGEPTQQIAAVEPARHRPRLTPPTCGVAGGTGGPAGRGRR